MHICRYVTYNLERVQRSATRYVLNDYNYTSSVTEMLKSLECKTHQNHRLYSSLTLFYKIRAQTVAINNCYLFPTRNFSYLIPQSRTQYFANSYFPKLFASGTPSPIWSNPVLALISSQRG